VPIIGWILFWKIWLYYRMPLANRNGETQMPTSVADIPFIFEQTAKCVHLAEGCDDGEIAARLLDLAQAFADRALQQGADLIRRVYSDRQPVQA
jgi:hypothetical protein